MSRPSDLGPLPRQHPREQTVETARRELLNAISEIATKHALTAGERLRILVEAQSEKLGLLARSMIRIERHGDTKTPGGLTR